MDCAGLPFTRQVSHSFGSESSQVPFYVFFAFFAVKSTAEFRMMGIPPVQRSDDQPGISDLFHLERAERREPGHSSCRANGIVPANADWQTVASTCAQAAPDPDPPGAANT